MKARLLILATLLLVALPTPAAHAVEPNGSFIRLTTNNYHYRIVGGAPLRIWQCTPLGNCAGIKDVANLNGYRAYPADGATVRNLADGGTYRFVNGTPLLVLCTYAPACGNRFDLNSLADTAHIRRSVPDGTVVRNVNDGGFYRFAGGAPLLVRCDIGPGCAPAPQNVDSQTLAKLGTATPSAPRMRQFPADGTLVYNADDNAHYRFAGGAPLLIPAPASGAKQIIDSRTLVQQGTATAALPHLRPYPADNTFLSTGAATFRVAGGAAVQLTNCGVLANCPGAVAVDPSTISGLAGGRLLAVPNDGTVLRGMPSNTLWEIVGGYRRQTYVNVAGVQVDDGAIGLIPVPPGPAPVVLPPTFDPAISHGYKVYRRYTRFTSLKVRDAPAGSVITVTCTGKKKGCPFKKAKQYRLKGSSLNIQARWFKKAKLRSRATVVVRVSSPAGERKQMTFKIRSRKLPVRTTRCSAAGGRLGRCA